jgi:hypothetical protein
VESNTINRRRLLIFGAVLLVLLAGVGILFLLRGPQDPAEAHLARCESFRDMKSAATASVVNASPGLTGPAWEKAWKEALTEARRWEQALDAEGCPR